MMTKLVEKVKNLVKEEYELASAIHGAKHNSPHEAVAVICEEIEESVVENQNVQKMFSDFWDGVKLNASDEIQKEILGNLRSSAILAACEMIQVAAMAHKAMHGYVIDEPIVPYEPMFDIGVDCSGSDDLTSNVAAILKEREGSNV